MKSAAGTFGYHRLASLALLLERGAPHLTVGDYIELLDDIDATYAAARELERQCEAQTPQLASY